MKKLNIIITLVFAIFALTTTNTFAGTFFDDFNDGNADGWILDETLHPHGLLGN